MSADTVKPGSWVGARGDEAILWTEEGFALFDLSLLSVDADGGPCWHELGLVSDDAPVPLRRVIEGSLGQPAEIDIWGAALPEHGPGVSTDGLSLITVLPAWAGRLLCVSTPDAQVCPGCVARRHLATQPAPVVRVRTQTETTLVDTLRTATREGAERLAEQLGNSVSSETGHLRPGVWFLGHDGGSYPVRWLKEQQCSDDRISESVGGGLISVLDPYCGVVVRESVQELADGLHQATATSALVLRDDEVTSRLAELSRGLDVDPSLARTKALAEAVERYAVLSCRPAVLPTSSPLNPRWDLGEWWPGSGATSCWVAATTPEGQEVGVPVELVCQRSGARAQANSNGVAAHDTRWLAAESALLELLERDAILRHWSMKQPGRHLRLDSEQLKRTNHVRDWRFSAQLLSTATALPAVLVAGRRTTGDAPRLALGAACRPTVDQALEHALREALGNALSGDEEPIPSLRSADAVQSLADHDSFYRDAERISSIEWWLDPTPCEANGESTSATTGRDSGPLSAMDAFREAGVRAAFIDLTPPDLAHAGLSVVRAVSPDLLPLWFGFGREPRGHRRLAYAHHPIDPHPFV